MGNEGGMDHHYFTLTPEYNVKNNFADAMLFPSHGFRL